MLKILLLFTIAFSWKTVSAQYSPSQQLDAMLDPHNKKVFVAAHRGDWRDAPENSIASMAWAKRLGVDIVEFDLKKTKDGEFVVMHDPSLNRTTTGYGLVSEHTLAELRTLRLRAGTGHPTTSSIPTFDEELREAGKLGIVLDIDQGWDYFPEVLEQVKADHAMDRAIINVLPNTPLPEFQKRAGDLPPEAAVMIIVNMARPDAGAIISSYAIHKRTIVQCIFADEDPPSMRTPLR